MLGMKTLQGAAWLVGSRSLGRAIDIVTLLIFARLLTPADFGMTALALTVVLIADMVLEVPVTQALTRLPQIDKSHLDTGFTLGLIRGVVIGLLVLGLSWPLSIIYESPELGPLMIVLAIAPIMRGLSSPQMVIFVRDMSFRQTFLMEVAGKSTAFFAAVATVLAGGGYWALVVNFTVANAAAAAISYLIAPFRPALSLARFQDFAGFIGWFSLAQLVAALNWQFDRLLLGAHVDKPTLGRYVVASDVAILPTQSLIGPAMQPVMAAFARIGHDAERRRGAFLKAARITMLVSAPMAVGIALIADLVVVILLGDQWREAAPLLVLLALSTMAIPYFQAIYALAVALDRPAIVFRLNAAELALRTILLPAGLMAFSVVGVALARIAVAAIMFLVYLIQVRQMAGLGLRAQLANLWKVAVAAAVMAAAVVMLRHGIAGLQLPALVEATLAAAVGAASYAAALLASGVWLVIGKDRLAIIDRW